MSDAIRAVVYEQVVPAAHELGCFVAITQHGYAWIVGGEAELTALLAELTDARIRLQTAQLRWRDREEAAG